MKKSVPHIAEKILRFFLPKREREYLLGDYAYLYEEMKNHKSKLLADLWYWNHVVKSIPAYIKNNIYWGGVMFLNYLKITIRNLRKHKVYSFINIFGLAVGIACCLFILLWVQDELSYDVFNENVDKLYRVVRVTGENKNERTPAVLAPTLKDEYPEIEEVCRFRKLETFMKVEDKFFNKQKLVYVDLAFFNLFTVKFVQGNALDSFKDISGMILSESYANKIFGNENPVGKVVRVGLNSDYVVSGIVEDFPSNSHIQFDCIVNFESRDKTFERIFGENSWRVNGFSTYVMLNSGVDVSGINGKIGDIIKRHHETSESEIYLQPVTDINLNPLEEEGNKKYLYIFSIIALFILTIACINFMNLSTARSSTRAKEVGMRKVIGANRLSLIKQFLGESFILTFISVLIASILVYILLPDFNLISGKQINFNSLLDMKTALLLIVITIITGLLAGGYPALFLSSMMPSTVLKKSTRSGKFAGIFRKYMVIVQFTISIILMIGVSVVYRQLSFMVETDLGYTKEHMLYYTATKEYLKDFQSIREELKANTNVVNASIGSPPMFIDFSFDNIKWEGKTDDKEITFAKYHVDYDYVKTLGLKILEGRDFSKNISTDKDEAYLINEEAAKIIGEPVINKELVFPGDILLDSSRVIGVVNNFHQSSFHEKILPVVLDINYDWAFTIIVRINPNDVQGTVRYLEDKWNERVKDRPFEYAFFDEEIDNFYKKENQMAKLLGTFSSLAIIIACLGLFGLVTFITEQRTKEIGIRKVLGSNIWSIVIMLANEFVKWVVIANVIAWPIAYFIMDKWLEGFAYRMDIGIFIFILSGVAATIIALATIAYQTIKAAMANPIDSLRYE